MLEMLGNTSPHSQALWLHKLGKGELKDKVRENQQREADTVLGMKLV